MNAGTGVLSMRTIWALIAVALLGASAFAVEPATKPAKKGAKADFTHFRQTFETFRDLTQRIEESSARKQELEEQLNQSKQQKRNPFFGDRSLGGLQAELHRLTKEREDLIRQKRDLAVEVIENSPRWREAIKARQKSSDSPSSSTLTGRADAEINRRLNMLDTLTRECYRMSGPGMRHPFGRGDGRGPMRMGARMLDDMPPMSVEAQIRQLEREQEVLKSMMRQNEEILERLRNKKAEPLKSASEKPVQKKEPSSQPVTHKR